MIVNGIIKVLISTGSDVLPWQTMVRYPAMCHDVKFIDVDFPDLMLRKCKVVQETSELSKMLSNIRVDESSPLLLQSDQYAQVSCDLRDLETLEHSIAKFVNIDHTDFLFVAEVSITYMETVAADKVIKWAGSLGSCKSCLLFISSHSSHSDISSHVLFARTDFT